jgi:hypothetical protein
MSRRPIAQVRVLEQPHLHPEAVRVEVDCRYSTTGLTALPGPMLALTREQLITSAVLEHEALCGSCDTEQAHRQGDPHTREMIDRAWNELLIAAQRRYDDRQGDSRMRETTNWAWDELLIAAQRRYDSGRRRHDSGRRT